jgi:hypothetical protein
LLWLPPPLLLAALLLPMTPQGQKSQKLHRRLRSPLAILLLLLLLLLAPPPSPLRLPTHRLLLKRHQDQLLLRLQVLLAAGAHLQLALQAAAAAAAAAEAAAGNVEPCSTQLSCRSQALCSLVQAARVLVQRGVVRMPAEHATGTGVQATCCRPKRQVYVLPGECKLKKRVVTAATTRKLQQGCGSGAEHAWQASADAGDVGCLQHSHSAPDAQQQQLCVCQRH